MAEGVQQARQIKLGKDNLRSQYWRLNNIYWIVDEEGRPTLFRMNEIQEDLYRNLHHRTCCPKSRQHGVTTLVDLLFLDTCLFNSHVSAAIIAHTLASAEWIYQTKIRYPYDQLDPRLLSARELERDRSMEMALNNESTIRVTPSSRSGTVQLLHVSEYAYISSNDPGKAKEIRTGSFESVHKGGMILVESTSRGQEGEFWDLVNTAKHQQDAGDALGPFDFELLFYPWWRNPRNRLTGNYTINSRLQRYFAGLEEKGVFLDAEQRNWYVAKERVQGEDMLREHPSTLEEAFSANIEGAWFARQMTQARQEGRITAVPHNPAIAVDTWWDLGMDDMTAIWFTQTVGRELHIIDYYENDGEGLQHYVEVLQQRRQEYGYQYGSHTGPHDLEVRELGPGKTRWETARALGLEFRVAPKPESKLDAIQAARNLLPICWFDEAGAAEGIERLDHYRKEWDDKRGVWKSQPRHDWASHGADAFQTIAVGHRWQSRKTGARKVQPVRSAGWT